MPNIYVSPHVWNLVAKQIRETYPTEGHASGRYHEARIERRILERLALNFTKRFTEDTAFDPIRFLDNCSPDTNAYPLSELWHDEQS